MASSSSSSSFWSSSTRWNYDVFLSFRGTDTRNTFTGHLYQALYVQGINVFIDNELQRGDEITHELLRVIQESRISIVILSERYASSSFCLDELVKILERKVSKGQTVIPVFYHMNPIDVKEQRGTFGQQFAKLEAEFGKPNIDEDFNYWKFIAAKASSLFGYVPAWIRQALAIIFRLVERQNEEDTTDMGRLQNWRLALTKVATLAGFHLKKGNHEANVINDIVKMVLKLLDHTILEVPKHPVGVACTVDFILKKLSLESGDVRMLGLYGMGGIGKTLIAKALYNRCVNQFKFDGRSFLSDVRECSKMNHGLATLQERLLSEVLGDQKSLSGNFDKGSELIKRRLRGKKVFIVIDNVDHIEQLQKLAEELEWFGAGSRIIITTRNSRLLNQHDVTMIYKVETLGDYSATELFCWHAFKKPQPRKTYLELTHRAIRYAQGLPLALVALGSSLYKRSVRWWDETLEKLEQRGDDEINEKIFNVLKVSYDSLDSEEKTIFLDIAFFLKGKNKDTIIKFLDGCSFYGYIGVEKLIEKSLLYDSGGRLWMHDLLEEMGTRIATENSSRLCIRKAEDILNVFLGYKRAYDAEILALDLYGEEEVPLNWLQNLTQLRILIISNGRFIKMPKKLPNSIRWLEWSNSCLTSIPSGFLPPNIVIIKMPCSIIKNFLIDTPKAHEFINLTHMNLSGSKHLKKMIDISLIPNLEVLDLRGCEKLETIPNLGKNQRLMSIDFGGYSKLENLPNLPTTITYLSLSRSGIKEIPLFIENLINLKYVYASNCENLICVSNGIYKLPNVSGIYLSNCPNLPQLPEAESSMASSNPTSPIGYMNEIDLSKNTFVTLPMNIFKFIRITLLLLNNCELLVEIPELPHTLRWLKARNCKSLVRFSQFIFDDSFDSDFSNCHKITENEQQSLREMVENVPKEDYFYWTYYYNTVIPGNEIPEWFSYAFDCEGIDYSFKLPLSVVNDNSIGFAWCIVFQVPTWIRNFAVRFIMNEFTFHRFDLYGPLELEHLWFGFYAGFDVHKLLEAEEISCQVDSSHIAIVLKRVGIHFIYKN